MAADMFDLCRLAVDLQDEFSVRYFNKAAQPFLCFYLQPCLKTTLVHYPAASVLTVRDLLTVHSAPVVSLISLKPPTPLDFQPRKLALK